MLNRNIFWAIILGGAATFFALRGVTITNEPALHILVSLGFIFAFWKFLNLALTDRKISKSETHAQITDQSALENILKSEIAVLFKHSPACGISAHAFEEIERFARTHPEIPIYYIDVLSHRRVSKAIAKHLQVEHQSPQVILMSEQKAVWHASHQDVTAEALAEHTRQAEAVRPVLNHGT